MNGPWIGNHRKPRSNSLHNEMVVASETSRATKPRLHDEVVSASETSKAKKPRVHDEMIAATEKSEAPETSDVSEDFETSDAFEESVQKGRETTRLLAVNTAFREVMSHVDFGIAMHEAIHAISTSERCAREWASIPTFFGDVFTLFRSGVNWYMEVSGQTIAPDNRERPRGQRLRGSQAAAVRAMWVAGSSSGTTPHET